MEIDRTLKNDDAWRKVCERTDLLDQVGRRGFYLISAKQLQAFSDERQPRLMVKFDFEFQRPKIFKQHKLNILPLKRGYYVVFKDPKNVCYLKLSPTYEPRSPSPYRPKFDLDRLDTLQKGICSTESDALDLAFLSSLLSTFCKTTQLMQTKRGRFGSSQFEIKLPVCRENLLVDRSQIEVDAIYESGDTIALVEAKIGFHDNFHIRQLFYPYVWIRAQKTAKRIVPILLCYSNSEFQLTEFKIASEFGEIKQIRQEYFVIDKYVLARGDLSILEGHLSSAVEVPSVPFPQADDMDKVVDVVRLAQRQIFETDKLVEIFGFVPRQADYYRNAAKYLGFIGTDKKITQLGLSLLSEPYRINRTEIILKSMLARPALREAILGLKLRNYDINLVSVGELEHLISKYRTQDDLSADTLGRRAITVRNWLKWLVANCDFR